MPTTTQTRERFFQVKLIDSRTLARFMDREGYSVRGLALEVERRIQRRNRALTCRHATIGHLRSGLHSSARPEVANAIEDSLRAPRGSLFYVKLDGFARSR